VPIAVSLSFQVVKSYEAYLPFPPGHPLLRKGRPSFISLLNQDTMMRFPLIVPERTDPAHRCVPQALARLGLPLNIAFEVGTIEAVKHYVSLGLGRAWSRASVFPQRTWAR
jgi:DNA-binding transcriptional LysR family regulator